MKMRDIAPFGFRVPPEVMAAVGEAAKRAGRSKNGQITQYVVQGLRIDGVPVRRPAKEKRPDGATRLGVGVTSPLDQERKRTRGY
jgi:hypothetical protein